MDSVISFFVWLSNLVLVAHFVLLMPLSIAQITDSRIRRQAGGDPDAQDCVLIIAAGWLFWLYAFAGVDPDQLPVTRAYVSYLAFAIVTMGWYRLRALNRKHQVRA